MLQHDRIALCSWSLQPRDPDDLIARCEELAITNVQLALSPIVRDGKNGSWSGAIERLREVGIRIVSGMMAMAGEDYSTLESIRRTGGVRPDETWNVNLAHAKAVAEIARGKGISLVTFHAGFLPEHPDGATGRDAERDKLLDRIRTIADVFADRDISLALETGQETADNLERALRAMDHPNICINFDPANMVLYNMGDPVAALRRLSPHLKQIHIKDAIPAARIGEWGAEVPAGEGHVNWQAFFEMALNIDPPMVFVIEREAGSKRVRDIAQAKQLILKYLA